MENLDIRNEICYAIKESQILEMAMGRRDESHMLYTAMKLSGAPWTFVTQVYRELRGTGYVELMTSIK